jgi:capsular exopolysaccharide synthesis family protein
MADNGDHNNQYLVEREDSWQAAAPYDNDVNFSRLVYGLLMRWYIIVLVAVIISVVSIPLVWLFKKPTYTVTGAIRIAPTLTSILSGEPDNNGDSSSYRNFMNTQAKMVTSPQVVERVADKLVEKDIGLIKGGDTSLIGKIKAKFFSQQGSVDPALIIKSAISNKIIRAETIENTELLGIFMEYKDSVEAKEVINAFIESYMAVEVSSELKGEDRNLGVLENEHKVLADKMNRQRQSILQLANEYGSTALDERHRMKLDRVGKLMSQLTELEGKRLNLESEVELLSNSKDKLSNSPEEMFSLRRDFINQDPTINSIKQNVAEMEEELIIAKQRLAASNPEIKLKEDLIASLEERVLELKEDAGETFDEMISQKISMSHKDKLAGAKGELEQVKAYEQRVSLMLSNEDEETIAIGRKQLMIQELQDQLEIMKGTYETIGKRIQELEMERKRPARISVAYNAEVVKENDRRKKLTFGVLVGSLSAGILAAFLLAKTDTSVRTTDDIVRSVGTKVIGTTSGHDELERSILQERMVEDYQTIRANIELLEGDSHQLPHMVIIASACPGEGKTTLAVNLSTSLAESGKRVLLVDGDLRKPDIAHLLDFKEGYRGISDLIFGKPWQRIIYPTKIAGLDLLAAHSRNSSQAYEILSSPKISASIAEAGKKYDHVIIDTPPVLAFPDALLWAKFARNVILTSFCGKTKASDLKETKERFGSLNINLLGTVLSNVHARQSYYRYDDYYSKQNCRRGDASRSLLMPLRYEEKS